MFLAKRVSPSIADFRVDLVVSVLSKSVRMARKARIEYAGAYYHVINRGNDRSNGYSRAMELARVFWNVWFKPASRWAGVCMHGA